MHTLGEVPEGWEGGEGYIDKQLIEQNVPIPSRLRHQVLHKKLFFIEPRPKNPFKNNF